MRARALPSNTQRLRAAAWHVHGPQRGCQTMKLAILCIYDKEPSGKHPKNKKHRSCLFQMDSPIFQELEPLKPAGKFRAESARSQSHLCIDTWPLLAGEWLLLSWPLFAPCGLQLSTTGYLPWRCAASDCVSQHASQDPCKQEGHLFRHNLQDVPEGAKALGC